MAKSGKPKQGKRDLPDGVVAASNGRVPMGTSAYALTDDASGKDFAYGTAVRKGNSKSGAPDNAGTATHRMGVMTPPGGNNRARFGIRVKMAGGPDPQLASQTQSNGRIMKSAVRRSVPDFWGGTAD